MINTKLGMIADVVTGPFGSALHQNEYVPNGIPVIMPQDIGNRSLSYEKIAYITEDKAKELHRYAVCKNDIVYARRGDVEKHAFINSSDIGAICGTGCLRVRIKSERVDPMYLSFYLDKPETRKWIVAHAVGSNMLNINSEILADVPVILPEVGIQKNTSMVLSTIEQKINNNNSLCADLEAVAKLLYDYWFVQFDFPDENGKPYKSSGGKMVWNEDLKREIPAGWEVKRLEGIYVIERGISYTSDDISSGAGVPMINLACVDRSRNYRDGELKYFNGKISYDAYLRGGDLLIACTDLTREREIIGCPILVPDDGIRYTYSMDMAKISFPSSTVNELYMYMALRTDYYHNFIKAWASGTNVLHLNLEGLDWYEMCIPPKPLQDRFGDIIRDIHSKKSEVLVENQQLASLRDFLLPMLMNGQVKVGRIDKQPPVVYPTEEIAEEYKIAAEPGHSYQRQ